jgi:EAL domain-containing protein (putative c-di-GMP-specific phosphodiesterase class I)
VSNLTDSIVDSLKLIIQPDDSEAERCLLEIGFKSVPAVSQLLYIELADHQLSQIFLKVSQTLSELNLALSRFSLSRSPLHSRNLLLDFLQAQPLSTITTSIKYAWFLRVLAKQSLFFKYQPIFNLSSGQVMGYECLARASSSQGSYFSGQELIDAALSTNLSCEFDELARMSCLEAIAEISNNVVTVSSLPTFFVNVLPNAIIRDPHSLEQNLRLVEELGLKPHQIVFELTELEALMRCPELLDTLNHLRREGFGIAIDDFCSYVSVDHYFMELEPDVIKLDKRLMHGCSRHTMRQLFIKSILRSAHDLNIDVLAEGLEDQNDIEFCRDIGIDYGQGFGLALPEMTLRQQPLNVIEFSRTISKAS